MLSCIKTNKMSTYLSISKGNINPCTVKSKLLVDTHIPLALQGSSIRRYIARYVARRRWYVRRCEVCYRLNSNAMSLLSLILPPNLHISPSQRLGVLHIVVGECKFSPPTVLLAGMWTRFADTVCLLRTGIQSPSPVSS
jgi:hypothetical protein